VWAPEPVWVLRNLTTIAWLSSQLLIYCTDSYPGSHIVATFLARVKGRSINISAMNYGTFKCVTNISTKMTPTAPWTKK